MGAMTKREALTLCKRLWAWLAKHPKSSKSDWPGWRAARYCTSRCPACEYATQRNEINAARSAPSMKPSTICVHCPLMGYAWKAYCGAPDSPFTLWADAQRDEERVRGAHQIEWACHTALRALPKPKKRAT